MNPYMEALVAVEERLKQSRNQGVSTREIVAKTFSPAEYERVVADLQKRPLDYMAAFTLASFIFERQEGRIPEALRRAAADNLADYVSSSVSPMDQSAIELFLRWGGHRADRRNIGLVLLKNPQSSVRWTALRFAPLFVERRDFSVLLDFRCDQHFSETMGMGGPLRFILRDEALKLLEQLTCCPVRSEGDCFENLPQGKVSYLSWSRFLNWYERHK